MTRRSLGTGLAALGPVLLSRTAFGTEARLDALMSVDVELRALAQETLAQTRLPLSSKTLKESRDAWQPEPPLPTPLVELRKIPGPAGGPEVAIEIIGANGSMNPRPAVLNIHGGGYVAGTARHMTAFCQRLAIDLDCVVVNVDYRLAPETPFPGPMEDNYAALLWLHYNASHIGADPSHIAVFGSSAGGGLAAMLSLAARDRKEVSICCQVLIYPMLDDRTGSTRRVPRDKGKILWTAEKNRFGWTSLLGVPAGNDHVSPGSVPARVADLAGLPPTFIGVGDIDLFADEDIEYARRLVHAGVPTTLLVVPGAFHAFDLLAPEARVSRMFTTAWQNYLRRTF
jgi:acetyl esterase/lipase